jgi:hypothetical protein
MGYAGTILAVEQEGGAARCGASRKPADAAHGQKRPALRVGLGSRLASSKRLTDAPHRFRRFS